MTEAANSEKYKIILILYEFWPVTVVGHGQSSAELIGIDISGRMTSAGTDV